MPGFWLLRDGELKRSFEANAPPERFAARTAEPTASRRINCYAVVVFAAPEHFTQRWTSLLGRLGCTALSFVGEAGRISLFFARALSLLPRPPFRFRAALEQIQFVGNRSVMIVALASAFTGPVLALQGYNALVRFGAEEMVGALVAPGDDSHRRRDERARARFGLRADGVAVLTTFALTSSSVHATLR